MHSHRVRVRAGVLAASWLAFASFAGSQPQPTEGVAGSEPSVPDRYERVDDTTVPSAASAVVDPSLSPDEVARRARVVARIEGVAITVGELEDMLVSGASERDVRDALEAAIRRVRLTREAARRGLGRHPDVMSAERRALVDELFHRDFEGDPRSREVDALVARLRASHVADVDPTPLYPLALDPRPRSMRDASAPSSAAGSAPVEGRSAGGGDPALVGAPEATDLTLVAPEATAPSPRGDE